MGEAKPQAAPWADDHFNSAPAHDALDMAATQVVQKAQIGANDLTWVDRRAGLGTCKPGDHVEFLGGWMVGAGGVPVFDDPAGEMEALLTADEAGRDALISNHPLQYDWRGGCSGIGLVKSLRGYLGEPIGGGPIHGGRLQIVSVNAGFVDVPSRACMVVVQTRDLSCEAG